jgi:hypothetical protein
MGNHLLLSCGIAAGPLFTVVYLLEGARRADYTPSRHPISALAFGPAGWSQTANFLVAGVLTLSFTVGLWRVGPSHWGASLVGVWAVSLLGAGAFRTDPVNGYPPGTPDRLARFTLPGALHNVLSLLGFLALAVACFVFAPTGSPGWAGYSIASGVLFAAAMVLSGAAFNQYQPLVAVGGLCQRVSLSIGWIWQTLLAVRLLSA